MEAVISMAFELKNLNIPGSPDIVDIIYEPK